MNSTAPTTWPQNLHEDSMMPSASAAEDYTSYLDLDLDFSQFDNIQPEDGSMDTALDGYNVAMNQQPGAMGPGPNAEFERQAIPQHSMPQQHQPNHRQRIPAPNSAQAQMYQEAHRYQRQQTIIPPTPTSNELHGGVAAYYHSGSGHIVYDQYHNKDEQISFTPLVSPAVTPADATFHLPEYAIPGEYFSPLASPAIEARHSHSQNYHGSYGPDSGASTSPADLNEAAHMSAPPTPVVTRQRRKPSTNNKSISRSVRQSPIVKPQSKRKSQLNLNPAAVAELVEAEHEETKNARPSGSDRTTDGSGQDSVSPEAIAEALMPPPALPHARSPAMAGQNKSPFIQGKEPVTPATLMRLQKDRVSKSPRGAAQADVMDSGGDIMEDISLGEPATSIRPAIAPIDTSTATLEKSKTPILSAQDSKSRPGSASAVVSASSTPVAMTPRSKDFASPDGTDPKRTKPAGRGSKKRQSVGASQVSPAIRPKISPNIKPLMPNGGGISADHSALYLASKSNYQNILDGTHLVQYPEALAENLSSKRTSHKIAEQGRRNRINTALKEIESLLPPSTALVGQPKKEASGSPEGEGSSDKAGNQTTSKANTVEMAIVYIKQLQAELHETKTKLDVAEKRLAEGTPEIKETSETSD